MNWERNTPHDRELRLVRPYALTGGRTRASIADLPIEALVLSTPVGLAADELRHEARAIVTLCHEPMSVAEVSARIGVPLGVARVMIGDLHRDACVEVHQATIGDARPDLRLLNRVLEGLKAL